MRQILYTMHFRGQMLPAAADAEVLAAPHDYFDRVVQIDLSKLEPH